MKDGRKIFFSGLLTALLIVSNIIAIKITVVAKLPLSCSIFVYPFTFLCTAVITELYGAKDARKSVYTALLVQLLVVGAFMITTNVPNQIDTIDKANALQKVLTPFSNGSIYYPEVRTLIASLVGFAVSQLLSIALYSFAKKSTFKAIAIALSVLVGIIIDSTFYIMIAKIGILEGNELIIQLVNRFVVGVVAALIMIPIFLLCSIKKKENEKITEENQ